MVVHCIKGITPNDVTLGGPTNVACENSLPPQPRTLWDEDRFKNGTIGMHV